MPARDNGIEINSLGLPIPLRSRGVPYIYGHMDFLCRDKDGLANLPTPSSPRNQAVSSRSIDVRVHCAKTGCPSPQGISGSATQGGIQVDERWGGSSSGAQGAQILGGFAKNAILGKERAC
jgi:hypothetical protein